MDALGPTGELFLQGRWQQGVKRTQVRAPYDGQTVGEVCMAGPEDLERALAFGTAELSAMRRLPLPDRARSIHRRPVLSAAKS